MKQVKAVIFDFDGTLVKLDTDVERIRSRLTDYLKTFGVDFYIRPIFPKIDRALEKLKEKHSGEKIAEIKRGAYSIIAEEEEKAARTAKVVGQALPTLNSLREKGLRLAIVSVNSEKVIKGILNKFHFPLIDFIVGREALPYLKPDIRVGEWMLKKLTVRADEVLFVGDTDYDIEMAEKLGMISVYFKSGGVLSYTKPKHIIANLEGVLKLI